MTVRPLSFCPLAQRRERNRKPTFGWDLSPARGAAVKWQLFAGDSAFSAVDLLQRLDRHLAFGDHAFELDVLGFNSRNRFTSAGSSLPNPSSPSVNRLLADLGASWLPRRPGSYRPRAPRMEASDVKLPGVHRIDAVAWNPNWWRYARSLPLSTRRRRVKLAGSSHGRAPVPAKKPKQND